MPSGGGYGSDGTTAASNGGTVSTTYFSLFNYGYSIDKYGNLINITMGSGSKGAATSTDTPATPANFGAGGGGGYGTGSAAQQTYGKGGSGSAGFVMVISW